MIYKKQNTILSHLLFFMAVRLENIADAWLWLEESFNRIIGREYGNEGAIYFPDFIVNTLGGMAQWCHAQSFLYDPKDKVWGHWCWYNQKPDEQ